MTSTFSQLLSLWPRVGGSGEVAEENQERLSPNNVISSQVDDSNHQIEDEEMDKQHQHQIDMRFSSCQHQRLPLQQTQKSQKGPDMSLEDLMRITKKDTKKERRHKYKQSFVRNNVLMVSLYESKLDISCQS
jgi:hypothetical protein